MSAAWAPGIRVRIPLILLFAGVTFVVANHVIGMNARRDAAMRIALVHGNGDADQAGLYLRSLPKSDRFEYLHEHTLEIHGQFAGVVDSSGRFVLVYPDSLLGREPRETLGLDVRTPVLTRRAKSRTSSEMLGDGTVYSRAQIDGMPGWRLVEARSAAHSLHAAEREAWNQTIPAALVGLLLTAMVAWFLSRWLHDPARRLVEAADRLAAGDLTARAGLTSSDELGRAGQAFDRMAERIGNTERELREARGVLAQVFEALPIGVLLVRRSDFKAMVVNSKWREMFLPDLQPGDHIPTRIATAYSEHDDGTPFNFEDMATPRTIRSGKPVTVSDIVYVAPDGRRVPHVVYAAPLQISPGDEFDSVLVVTQDRRELVGLLEELRVWENRYAKVAEATGQIVFDWDLAKGTVKYSGGYATVLGYEHTAEHTPSLERWKGRIHPEDRARAVAALETSLRDASPFEQEYRMRRNDGCWITIHDRGFFETDEDGRPVRMYGTMSDVTDRHELEAQLRQAQKMETVGTLAGGVAHDFNNQLTGVLGHLDLLTAGLDPTDSRLEHVRIARQAAERCATLTRGLLAFSRRLASHPRPTDMHELIRETAQLLSQMLPASIRIETDLTPGLPTAMVDGVQAQQVLFNLCVNARDAMPQGGRLRLATRAVEIRDDERSMAEARAGHFVELTVEDNGTGIAPEALSRIFEPFYTTKPLGEGTGLGLSMVYGIVSKHQGWVEVDSTLGKGAIFRVYLPVADSPAPPSGATSSAQITGAGELVLVVDDETVVRELCARALTEQGYHVLKAQDGEEALALFREQHEHIRLVVLDVIMPGMGGVEVLRHIRTAGSSVRVLLTSGFAPDNTGPAAGEDAFLAKPYTTSDLLLAMRRLLDRRPA